MSTWEYRVIQDGDWLSIHEVHYNGEGVIDGWVEEASYIAGESLDQIKNDATHQLTAFYKPVLLKEELPQ
jgi:hypothetical protein